MVRYEILTSATTIGYNHKSALLNFFEDYYPGEKEKLSKAIDHAAGGFINNSGLVIFVWDKLKIIGGLVLCKTGMNNFWIDNVICYIALEEVEGVSYRDLLEKALKNVSGKTAVTYNPSNPHTEVIKSILPAFEENIQLILK